MVAERLSLVTMGCLAALVLATAAGFAQYYEDTLEPEEIGIRDIQQVRTPEATYAGNDVCRLCHEAAYQTWLGTGHARAFVPLRSMMGMMMGEQQEITASSPAKSGKCLRCHGTAADVPAAYRGPGFRMGEGVACEKCHGPGGEHVAAMEHTDVDADPAMCMPGRDSCEECHAPKRSHAKLEKPPFDLQEAWERILHPRSDERPEDEMEPRELGIWRLDDTSPPPASYVGSAVCSDCHQAAYRTWEGTGHARATRVLRSDMGVMMNMKADMNVIGGPMKNAACLGCHATGHDAPAAFRESGFRMREGVGCEKCHGPGERHVKAMRAQEHDLPDLGLVATPKDQDCLTCHKRKKSHEALQKPPFSFPRAWGRIAHP